MIPPDLLLSFFAASLLLGLAPGPDNLYVLSQSALAGRAAGLSVTLGLCTGLIGHTLAVALGAAALLAGSPLAFALLKALGAGYLLYLAWGAWRAAPAPLEPPRAAAAGLGRLYRRGILMNLSNPKVSLFFLAFLPQFADPARGPLTPQILLLGGVFILATLLVFGAVALLAGAIQARLGHSARAQRLLNRLTAVVFVGLAIRLVMP